MVWMYTAEELHRCRTQPLQLAAGSHAPCTPVQVYVTSSHLAIVTEHADLGTMADYLAGQRNRSSFQVCSLYCGFPGPRATEAAVPSSASLLCETP